MRIGYACINRTIGCSSSRTFRMSSYSEERLVTTVAGNLACLQRILEFNAAHNIGFFRITSDLIPFASHPINRFDWAAHFREELFQIGQIIRTHAFRISMHPDQFNVINAIDPDIFQRTVKELTYHARVLDAMALDTGAKIQIHVGGVYADKPASLRRFVQRYETLPQAVKNRLVIENDDRLYTLSDCLAISQETGIPVLFDTFHHQLNSSGQTFAQALAEIAPTWRQAHGVPMVDYSSQEPTSRHGSHAQTLDARDFGDFIAETQNFDFDIMLEIKDKEISTLKAIELARKHRQIS